MKNVLFALFVSSISLTAFAQYIPNNTRGSQTTSFNTPDGLVEQCVIPKPFPGAKVGKKDQQKEQQLCSLDFWGLTPAATQIAICPKYNSTFPGVNAYEIPVNETRDSFETRICKLANPTADEDTEKVAKFKQSVSCGYTPSMLAYYQLGNFLDIGKMPPTVIRTMTRAGHKAIVDEALVVISELINQKKLPADALIAQTWTSLGSVHNEKLKKDVWVMPDKKQIYGALHYNPGGEVKYTDLNGKGGGDARYATYKTTRIYQAIASTSPVSKTIPRTMKDAAPAMVAMKDASDMILIDYLLNQNDRLGNIHAKAYWYSLDPTGKLQKDKADVKVHKDAVKIAEQKAEHAAALTQGKVLVKEMLLKDNDCGVAKDNKMKVYGLLDDVNHMNADTYQRLLKLGQMIKDPSVQAHFINELLFTQVDLKSVGQNIVAAITKLQGKCRAGQLMLDLDWEAHVRGDVLTGKPELCELQP